MRTRQRAAHRGDFQLEVKKMPKQRKEWTCRCELILRHLTPCKVCVPSGTVFDWMYSFPQSHHSCIDSPPHPLVNPSLSSSLLSSSTTPSLFHPRLQSLFFQQILHTLDFFPILDCVHDNETGPDLSRSSLWTPAQSSLSEVHYNNSNILFHTCYLSLVLFHAIKYNNNLK